MKSQIGKETLKYLYLSIAIGFLTFFVESGFVLVLQKFLQSIGILSMATQSKYLSFLDSVLMSSIALVVVGVIRAVIYGLRAFCANLTQHTYICSHRLTILSAALNKISATSTKEVVSIFSDLVGTAGNLMNYLSILLTNLMAAVAYFFLALYLAPYETIFGISFIFVLLLPTRSLSKRVKHSGESLVKEWENLNGTLLLGIKNNFLLKVYNLIPQEIAIAQKSVGLYRGHIKYFSMISSLVASLPSIVGLFVLAVLTSISLHFGTPPFKLVSFFYIFLKLVQSLSDINQTSANIRMAYPSLKKLMDWEDKMRQYSMDQDVSKIADQYKVDAFHHFKASIQSFSYQNEVILKDISLELHKGDVLVIKGPSGVGKSTLLGLLLGILTPNQGCIEMDEKPVGPMIQANSRLVAYVGPEPFLIQGSVRENLLYGFHQNISEAQLFDSLKKVGLYDFVQALPKKMDSGLSEVAELSTGQRQRLSIARALLRPFDLLVLDEATANLDLVTENQVIQSIAGDLKNKITIIVTHKKSFDHIGTQFIELEKSNQ